MNGTVSTSSPLSDAAREQAPAPVPITASEVRCGDVLIYEGREIVVTTRPRRGSYWFGAQRDEGLAIDWRAGTASGIMFRLGAETMHRVRRAD